MHRVLWEPSYTCTLKRFQVHGSNSMATMLGRDNEETNKVISYMYIPGVLDLCFNTIMRQAAEFETNQRFSKL